MKIEIYGTGCAKCNKLYENVKKAVEETGADATVEKIEDLKKITEAGVFMTPALAVDGEVKFSGKVPGVDKLKKIIG
jgi:small redox-active disulfide protein 2